MRFATYIFEGQTSKAPEFPLLLTMAVLSVEVWGGHGACWESSTSVLPLKNHVFLEHL